MNLILASTSPARAEILKKLKLNFIARAPQIDETPQDGEIAEVLVRRLAIEKALAVPADEDDFVIACDQVASFNGEIIGKPHYLERAQQQLSAFSGQKVQFFTGLALRHQGKVEALVEPFAVQFRELNRAEIEKYLQLENVLQCAGSIKSEALGVHLFSAFIGRDPNALTGLPIIALGELMRKFGRSIFDFYE